MKSKLTLLPAAAICFVVACNNSSTTKTKAMLIGSWKAVALATDLNINSVMDSSEIYAVPSDEAEVLTFKPGGKGSYYVKLPYSNDTYSMSYAIDKCKLTIFSDKGHSSTQNQVDSISGSTLILRSLNEPIHWAIYTRQ